MKNESQQNDARSRGIWQGMNWIRKDLRLAIYLRDGLACSWCGAAMEDGVMLTLDHVIPHSKGGGNKPANLVCACEKCNKSRGNRTAKKFAAAVAEYIDHDIKAEDILAGVREHAKADIAQFRAEAKTIIARRPSWQAALEEAVQQ